MSRTAEALRQAGFRDWVDVEEAAQVQAVLLPLGYSVGHSAKAEFNAEVQHFLTDAIGLLQIFPAGEKLPEHLLLLPCDRITPVIASAVFQRHLCLHIFLPGFLRGLAGL